MEIIRIPRIVQDTCREFSYKGKSIGCVPTMGALHEGHLSLLKRARTENDIVVASIFVNPVQFGPAEDFENYPRPIEDDIKKFEASEVDILFLPDGTAMYPKDFATFVTVDALSEKLCGQFRPGHFRGVATVVAKLFNIIHPTRAYFGQKDYQQTVIVKRMVKDLNFSIDIVVCPTIREYDGLAMSSRNSYLDEQQRKAALACSRSLSRASDAIKSGIMKVEQLKRIMSEELSGEHLITQTDYASIYDSETLDEASEVQGEVLIAVAVRVGDVRLIDNMLINM